jgi:hypothetical protein
MALPRFSFSGGATDFFQPNQALFRTTFTPSDKLQSDTYQAEAKAYKDAVEKYNEAIKVNPEVAPPKPTPLSFTQEEFDQFGVDASRRAQQLQNTKQNTFNAISNPSGFSQHYGIGSLGFGDGGEVGEGMGSLSLDNRYREAKVFDLDYVEDAERYNSREELEQLNPSFMVGRYKISPNISGSYQMSSVDIPQNIDGKQLLLKEKYKQGDGNLGFDVDTPNRHGFGANVSGNYFTGSKENPEELQAFGDPAKENYGEGFLPQEYNAYYRTPEGLTISGNYREENPDQEREYGIMLSKQIEFQNVKDLTDRIARLLEKNRP